MRGFLVGTLTLAVLQVLVSGAGPDQAAGLLGYVTAGLDALGDPSKPALPNRARSSSTTKAAPKPRITPKPKDGTVPGSPGTDGTLGTGQTDPFLRAHGGLASVPVPNPARTTYTA